MKKIYVFFILTILFMPFMVNASNFNEVPPYIEIVGIDEDDYDIIKTITSDKVIVSLTEKDTKEFYSWSFDKDKVKDKIKLDFNIDFVSSKEKEINSIAGNTEKTYISFSHHGDLPSDADIRIYVGDKYKNGEKLNLYYYNEEEKQVEFTTGDLKVEDGFVKFKISHCSDYFLTSAIVNDAINNPKSVNYIIVALFFVVFILIGYTLFLKK